MSWTLDFTLLLEVEAVVEVIDEELGDEIVGSFLRESPVAVDPIAPSYSAYLGETIELQFDFADPLVLEPASDEPDSDELLPEGL